MSKNFFDTLRAALTGGPFLRNLPVDSLGRVRVFPPLYPSTYPDNAAAKIADSSPWTAFPRRQYLALRPLPSSTAAV